MVFVVKENFKDLKDNDHIYEKGDLYPFEEKEISPSRYKELSTNKNRRKKPLIEETALDELTEIQLLNYAKRLGIELKPLINSAIISALEKDESSRMDKTQEENYNSENQEKSKE